MPLLRTGFPGIAPTAPLDRSGAAASLEKSGVAALETPNAAGRANGPRDVDGHAHASGAGHAHTTLDIAKLLLARLGRSGGDVEAKRLLDEVPALREAVKLFQWVSVGADEQCHHHCVVNTDEKLSGGTKDLGAVEDLLRSYARRLGYADCSLDKTKGALTLIAADGTKVAAGAVDPRSLATDDVGELFRKLGRLVNQTRIGAPTGVPPTLPLDATTRAFSVENAVAACHLSMLAYETAPNIKAQLDAWGFATSTFSFLEDKTTDTQAFVCADKQGHVHVVFRGTSSGTDAMTDVSSRFVAADWAPGVKVHEGFASSLDAVWPQVTSALEKARAKTGASATVFFAGHSLGGALTQLCAAKAATTGLVDDAIVYTKGGPRVGNDAFKQLAEAKVPRTFRLVHSKPGFGFDNDPVTGVPPRFMGFRHAGNMVKITDAKAEVILAGTPGTKSALETRMFGAMRSVGLEMTADALDQNDDASDPPDRAVEALRGAKLSAHVERIQGMLGARGASTSTNGDAQLGPSGGAQRGLAQDAALESFSTSLLGVGLHYMNGYLEDVGKELLRKLR